MANPPNDSPVTAGQATTLNQGAGEPGFDRTEPLLTPSKLRKRFLFGIPLRSSLNGDEMDDEDLEDFIMDAVGDFETSVRVPVAPVRITDRFDFERADDAYNFSPRRLTRWPVIQIEALEALWPGRSEESGTPYPTSWVSLQGDSGFVRIVPVSGTLVGTDQNFIASTAYGMTVLGGMKSWPNMWRITYLAGFPADRVPKVVNRLIGVIAALTILSQMGPAMFPVAGTAVGIDGMSQSISTAGPQWLAGRCAELEQERTRLTQQLMAHYGTDILFAAF